MTKTEPQHLTAGSLAIYLPDALDSLLIRSIAPIPWAHWEGVLWLAERSGLIASTADESHSDLTRMLACACEIERTLRTVELWSGRRTGVTTAIVPVGSAMAHIATTDGARLVRLVVSRSGDCGWEALRLEGTAMVRDRVLTPTPLPSTRDQRFLSAIPSAALSPILHG